MSSWVFGWIRRRIVFAPVDLAGRHPVAEHLRHVFQRHLHRLKTPLFIRRLGGVIPPGIVDPILEMVPVAPLVVHPGPAAAGLLPLLVVGAAEALVVAASRKELLRTVFREIVGKPLPVQAYLKTQSSYGVSLWF